MKLSRRALLKLTGSGAVLGTAGALSWEFASEQRDSQAVATDDLLPVKVKGIYTDPVGARVVLLAPEKGNKALRVWVGDAEAMAIFAALNNIPFPRPMTHDLLNAVIKALGGKVERVVISDLSDNTFYATVYLRSGKGIKEIDARPSDSIALALRAKAPIYLAPKVQRAMGPLPEGAPPPIPPELPRRERRGIRT